MINIKSNRTVISALIIFAVLLIALVYVQFGEEKIDGTLEIQKEKIAAQLNNIDLSIIRDQLLIDNGLLLITSKQIEIKKNWSASLPFECTYQPLFDYHNFYFIADNEIYAYAKKGKPRRKYKRWQTDLKSNILHAEILDGNLLIAFCKDGFARCIRRDNGKNVWEREMLFAQASNELSPQQISLEKDLLLNRTLTLLPSAAQLMLFNNYSGLTLSVYKAQVRIRYLSDFDESDKALYLIEGEKLVCVRLLTEK